MQVQDYLLFFQNLFLEYYHFTLANAVYATCLGISVWLLTAILYSFNIASLRKQLNASALALQETQKSLADGQQEISSLKEEIIGLQELIGIETNNVSQLKERIGEFEKNLSDSILSFAANPELGQQGLSVSQGLSIEHLWQRYSAAVKLLAENLIAQRQTSTELLAEKEADSAKISDLTLQLQSLELRYDSQKQQIDKLQLSVYDYKTQILEEQEKAQQNLKELEAKFQADLARLSVLEKRPIPQQPAKAIVQETVKPAAVTEVLDAKQLIAKLNEEIGAKKAEQVEKSLVDVPLSKQESPVSSSVTNDTASESAQTLSIDKKSTGIGGKFKSMFAGLNKSNSDSPEANEQVSKVSSVVEQVAVKSFESQSPTVVEPKESKPVEKSISLEQNVDKPQSGFGGKFKSFVANAQQRMNKLDAALGVAESSETQESIAGEAEVVHQSSSEKTGNIQDQVIEQEPEKNKGFLGFSFPGKKLKAEHKEVATPVIEPTPSETITKKTDNALKSQMKGLFGKFKK